MLWNIYKKKGVQKNSQLFSKLLPLFQAFMNRYKIVSTVDRHLPLFRPQ